jgi:hypothetical protein
MVRKVYKPPHASLQCMAGEKETTVQDYVNQTVPKGDAPAQENRGASVGLGGQAPQVDKRAIIALLRAIANSRSFAVWRDDFYDELQKLVTDKEPWRVEDVFIEAVRSGKVAFTYYFEGTDWDDFDTIAVIPIRLRLEHIAAMRYVHKLILDDVLVHCNDYIICKRREVCEYGSRESSTADAIDALARIFLKEVMGFKEIDVGYAIYVLAKYYNLDVEVVNRDKNTMIFKIPDVGVEVWYHNYGKNYREWIMIKKDDKKTEQMKEVVRHE